MGLINKKDISIFTLDDITHQSCKITNAIFKKARQFNRHAYSAYTNALIPNRTVSINRVLNVPRQDLVQRCPKMVKDFTKIVEILAHPICKSRKIKNYVSHIIFLYI